MVNRKRTLFYLGVFDAIMICSVSLVGILFQQIYSTRQNTIPLYALMGQDIITFIVGTVLLITLLTENQKHIKTKIVSLGCLLYSIYIYAYFCFGLVSSLFYIIYIVILSVSVYCFIFNLFFVREDYTTLIINTKYPRKSISLLFIITACLMIVIEINELIFKTITRPGEIISFDVFYVLDLSLLFPAMIIVAVLNIKNSYWGYLFSGIFLIKLITLLPGMILGDLINWINTGIFVDLSFSAIGITVTGIAIILSIFYLKGVMD